MHPNKPTKTQSALWKRAIRWFLLLDRPLPYQDEQGFLAYREQHYRWNYIFNLLDGMSFWAGLSFASTSTIMPLFVSKLTTDRIAFGALAVITQAGWFLPQLFVANFAEQIPHQKAIVVNLGFFLERLPFIILPLIPLLAPTHPTLTVILFLLIIAWHVVGAGVIGPSWQELIVRCFPPRKRGGFLGLTTALGTGAGVLSATIARRILATTPFPLQFTILFALAAMLINLSWLFIAMVREPVPPTTKPRQDNRAFMRELPTLLRNDLPFRRFLIARLLIVVGGLGSGFLTPAAIVHWGLPDDTVAIYTTTLLAGQAIGNLLFGTLADRWGHKQSVVLGTISLTLAYALASAFLSPMSYALVFFLQGLGIGSLMVSGLLVVIEFAPPDRRPTYIGITNTTIGLISIFAPTIGTAISALGYPLLFAIGATISAIAAATMHWGVRDPTA